jgi:hypothetical protein
MENKTHIYSNTAGDSIQTTSVSGTLNKESEVFLDGYPQGTTGEKYTQVVTVDTVFDYTTVLISEFLNGTRNDIVFIDGMGLDFFGRAEPEYSVNGSFKDTLSINGINYIDVFRRTTADENTSLFVNLSEGLVAFTIEKDTFNLVN